MPIIDFTPADALQTVTMDAGIYPAVISKIDGPKASASQKSVTFWVDVRLNEGRYAGKELRLAFNSGTKDNSMLGTQQFVPQAMFLQVEAAQNGTKVEPIARPGFDTDTLINKPFCVQIGVTPNADGGGLLNQILGFLPVGADKISNPFG